MKKITRTYSELILLPTFEERFEYLKLDGLVGEATFGYDRYLNQALYTSDDWRKLRNKIIDRDFARDLGIEGRELNTGILIHHLNPINKEDILYRRPNLFDPNNLICVSKSTHNAIHYGDASLLVPTIFGRSPNDTCPWKAR